MDTIDRLNARKIAQAVIHAQRKGGEDTLSEMARNSAGRLVPIPRTHPFRDPSRFTYSGELEQMAKASGVRAYDQLAHNLAPDTLSRLANLQVAYGRPMEINAAFSATGHKKTGAHPRGMAFDINVQPPTAAERARVIELATQMGFTGTGSYQSPADTKKGFDDPRVHIDVMRPRTWGFDGHPATTPAWHKNAVRRGLAAGEPDMEAIAAKVAAGSPVYDLTNLYRRRPPRKP